MAGILETVRNAVDQVSPHDTYEEIPLTEIGLQDRMAEGLSSYSSDRLGVGEGRASQTVSGGAAKDDSPADPPVVATTKEKAAGISDPILQQTNAYPAGSSLADVAPGAKGAVARFAMQHLDFALEQAKSSAIRAEATDAIDRLTQNSAYLDKTISADTQTGARQVFGRSGLTDLAKPRWQKTPGLDIAQYAAPKAVNWLEKQPADIPALDYKSALDKRVDAAVAEFQRGKSVGSPDRTSAPSGAEGSSLPSVPGVNDTSEVFEAAGNHVATQTARDMYAVGTAARSALKKAIGENAEKALKEAMVPVLGAWKDIERTKSTGSGTRTLAEWNADSLDVQERLQQQAAGIATDTLRKYS